MCPAAEESKTPIHGDNDDKSRDENENETHIPCQSRQGLIVHIC